MMQWYVQILWLLLCPMICIWSMIQYYWHLNGRWRIQKDSTSYVIIWAARYCNIPTKRFILLIRGWVNLPCIVNIKRSQNRGRGITNNNEEVEEGVFEVEAVEFDQNKGIMRTSICGYLSNLHRHIYGVNTGLIHGKIVPVWRNMDYSTCGLGGKVL